MIVNAQNVPKAEQRRIDALDVGILVLRLGFGALFILHGLPKLLAGPEVWSALGEDLGYIGISRAFPSLGFSAGLVETLGGACLLTGLFLRPACLILLLEMLVAMSVHVARIDGFLLFAHTLSNAIVFLALLICGPGRFSLGGRKKKDTPDSVIVERKIDPSHSKAA